MSVETVGRDELMVHADLGDTRVLDDYDSVSVTHRAQVRHASEAWIVVRAVAQPW